MYASLRNSNEIASFSVDSNTGSLRNIGKISVEASPTYLCTDRRGKFLLAAYYQGRHVGVHQIQTDHSLKDTPVQWLETDIGAHSINVDRSNRYAFVPHIARIQDNVLGPPPEDLGPNVIYQFKFDPDSGKLSPNTPLRLDSDGFLGPRHYCYHPSLDIVYFSNEQGCSVTAYRFDRTAGTLSAFQTISTLPQGYQGDNTCAQIQISPNGRFLYAPNRGHNSIACFTVDQVTDELAPIGQTSSEDMPRVIGLDPQGKFLFAAGHASGRLASYRINNDTGNLEPLEIYPLGERPMWVMIIELPG
ncbi:MAG: lactonase family protein [Dehalococcoidia bacterium]|nr:lactonase family protein [Dehalococcoidia bacterium]